MAISSNEDQSYAKPWHRHVRVEDLSNDDVIQEEERRVSSVTWAWFHRKSSIHTKL